MKRFDNNLNSIVFISPDEVPLDEASLKYGYMDGEYKTKEGKFIMYYDEKKYSLATQDDFFESTLMHELTHVAYTEKDKYNITEKHIFGEFLLDDERRFKKIKGSSTLIEPIVNFISSEVSGIRSFSYIPSTAGIRKISDLVGVETIVKSAWKGNEEYLKNKINEKCINPDAYDVFVAQISKLNNGYNKKAMDRIDNLQTEEKLKVVNKASDTKNIIKQEPIELVAFKQTSKIEALFQKAKINLLNFYNNISEKINPDYNKITEKIIKDSDFESFISDTDEFQKQLKEKVKTKEEILPTKEDSIVKSNKLVNEENNIEKDR